MCKINMDDYHNFWRSVYPFATVGAGLFGGILVLIITVLMTSLNGVGVTSFEFEQYNLEPVLIKVISIWALLLIVVIPFCWIFGRFPYKWWGNRERLNFDRIRYSLWRML